MDKSRAPNTFRSILFLLVLVGFTWFILTRFASFGELLSRLVQGLWGWVLLAFVMHFFYFFLYAVLYHFSFRAVGVRLTTLQLFPVLFAALFVNAVAPAGGAGGAAIFIDYAARRRQSGARTAVGVLLTLVTDLFTLIPFIGFGVVFLSNQHHLRVYEWLAFLFYVIFVLGLAGLLMAAYWKPAWLRALLHKLQGWANQLGEMVNHPDLLSEQWAERNANEFIDGAGAVAQRPRILAEVLMIGVLLHLINMIGLYAFFLAYQQPVSMGTLNAAFSLGIVFFIVTIVPQGVGAVEGIMGLILVDMGVSRTTAGVIALAYRGVNFWIPIVIGFFALQVLFVWARRETVPSGGETVHHNGAPQEEDG